jgi:hypothetical protein
MVSQDKYLDWGKMGGIKVEPHCTVVSLNCLNEKVEEKGTKFLKGVNYH